MSASIFDCRRRTNSRSLVPTTYTLNRNEYKRVLLYVVIVYPRVSDCSTVTSDIRIPTETYRRRLDFDV